MKGVLIYFCGFICSCISLAIHIEAHEAVWAAVMGACAIVTAHATIRRFADWTNQ